MRYLALGDSYSFGEGVPENGRWPMQLSARLRAQGIRIDDPCIIARTGWTTDELAAAMDEAEPLGQWDRVSLLIGVNNQYRSRALDEYREHFSALLDRAIALADGVASHVLVLSIPDWGVTPFAADRDSAAIAREIDAFNAAASRICTSHGVDFIDITPTSRDRGNDAGMIAQDGLHPSATMYSRWVDVLLERPLAWFRQSPSSEGTRCQPPASAE
ncbi:SGNH/GDSL hydrolase family protein [Xanthomonadaceae bacterium XH05]|nr:SGNH/GDSL hydrolase family protein [Xanthomonadaceae bacterium XH05]